MFVILLRFSTNRHLASRFMDGHKAWIQSGFEDGVFLLLGSLHQDMGGGILANDIGLDDLRQRVDADPFVAEQVVTAEILELIPNRSDARLDFLLDVDQNGRGA